MMNAESELIRAEISRYTTSDYEFTSPTGGFPTEEARLAWLMVSPFKLVEGSHSPAPFIWEDRQGNLHVQSAQLGDTSRWVEGDYGEKGAIKLMRLGREFSRRSFKDILKQHFPDSYKRLLLIERAIANSASKGGVELGVANYRNKFIITLYAIAAIDAKNLDTQTKIEKIKLSIDAIKEAISEIGKFEAGRNQAAR